MNGIIVFGQSSSCEVGRRPPPLDRSFPSPAITGQYLDMLHPATCNGRLSTISICYSATLTPGAAHRLVLRVWRQSEDRWSTHLKQVREIQLMVQISSKAVPDSSHTCANHSLDQVGHIDLVQGDILGILLPSQSDFELPVVTNNTQAGGLYRVTRESIDTEFPLMESDLAFESTLSLEIHAVYTAMLSTPQPTPVTLITASPTSPVQHASQTPTSMQRSLASEHTNSVSTSLYLPTVSFNSPSAVLQVPPYTTTGRADTAGVMSAQTMTDTSMGSQSSLGGQSTILPLLTREAIVGTEPVVRFTSSLLDPTFSNLISTREEISFPTSLPALPQTNVVVITATSGMLSVTEQLATKTFSLGIGISVEPSGTSTFGLTLNPSVLLESSTRLHHPPTVSVDFQLVSPSQSLLHSEFGAGASKVLTHLPTMSLPDMASVPAVSSSKLLVSSTSGRSREPRTLTSPQPTPTLLVPQSLQPAETPSPDLESHLDTTAHFSSTLLAPTDTSLQSVVIPTPYPASYMSHMSVIESTNIPPPSTTHKEHNTLLNSAIPGTISSIGLPQTPSGEMVTPSSLGPQLSPSSPSLEMGAVPVPASPSSLKLPSSPAQPTTGSQDSTPLPPSLPTSEQPDGKHLNATQSFISIIVAVCVLLCTLSGCIFLMCIYISHCRKISKVDQRRRSVLEIGNNNMVVTCLLKSNHSL